MKLIGKGTGLESFFQGLKKNAYKEIGLDHCVLVKASDKYESLPGGRCRSYWIYLDEDTPYYLQDGKCFLDSLGLILSHDEYEEMEETGIAVYDSAASMLYPLRKSALTNLLKLLDYSSGLKTEDPLIIGMLLSKHLSEISDARMMYYERQGRVMPVFSITSKKYVIHDSLSFIDEIMDEIAGHCLYTVPRWEIWEEQMEIEIMIVDDYKILDGRGFILTLSDVAGTATSLTAFYKTGKTYIYLRRNKLEHKKEKLVIRSLFAGMWYEFRCFEKYYQQLPELYIKHPETFLYPFEPILGKKRYQKQKEMLMMSYTNALEFYMDVITNLRASFSKGSVKWTNLLRQEYYNLIKAICTSKEIRKVSLVQMEEKLGMSVDEKGQMKIIV